MGMLQREEINQLQITLPAKKLALELIRTLSPQKQVLRFEIVNDGGVDVEPLEVTIKVPSSILYGTYRPVADPAVLEVHEDAVENTRYTVVRYRNNRESLDEYTRKADALIRVSGITERLVSRLAPGMRSPLKPIEIEVKFPLSESDLESPIRYQIFAKGLKTTEQVIVLTKKLDASVH
jgi:hypothetical protein